MFLHTCVHINVIPVCRTVLCPQYLDDICVECPGPPILFRFLALKDLIQRTLDILLQSNKTRLI